MSLQFVAAIFKANAYEDGVKKDIAVGSWHDCMSSLARNKCDENSFRFRPHSTAAPVFVCIWYL